MEHQMRKTLKESIVKYLSATYHFGINDALRLAPDLLKTETQSVGAQSAYNVRLPGLNHDVTLRRGTSDARVCWQTFIEKQYYFDDFPQNRQLRLRYDSLVAAGKRPIIIDCGANIGMSSLWFSKEFPKAQIFAIEPHRGNYDQLVRNLREVRNIVCMHGAIWDQNSNLTIADPSAEEWAFRIEERSDQSKRSQGPTSNDLQCFTIDELLNKSATSRAFIIKIDIEGGEKELFRSNTQWAALTDLMIIELHDYLFPNQGTSRSFLRTIAATDCELLIRGENLFVFNVSHNVN
jgi:FkbM family methyltransferase